MRQGRFLQPAGFFIAVGDMVGRRLWGVGLGVFGEQHKADTLLFKVSALFIGCILLNL